MADKSSIQRAVREWYETKFSAVRVNRNEINSSEDLCNSSFMSARIHGGGVHRPCRIYLGMTSILIVLAAAPHGVTYSTTEGPDGT